MNFRVGQKVVCVTVGGPCSYRYLPMDEIKVGEVYTVRRLFMYPDGDLGVDLVEVDRSEGAKRDWGFHIGFGAWRFRPVVDRKTDISIFTKMLDDVRAKEPT